MNRTTLAESQIWSRLYACRIVALQKQRELYVRSCKFTRSPHRNCFLKLFCSKYGNVHKQLRALTILDGLIENAGPRFRRVFADEPLLERLRVAATDPVSNEEVKRKCQILFRQWAVSYSSTPGMERITALRKQVPKRKKPVSQEQSKVLRDTAREARETDTAHNTSASNSSSLSSAPTNSFAASPTLNPLLGTKSGKKGMVKPFNLEKEKPQLLQTIASSSVASTNLMNSLQHVNRENKRVSEDPEATKRFNTCKSLRRQILRYIQHIESEQWLGSLIHANDELVEALMAFEVLDKSVDDDSDSDEGEWNEDHSISAARSRKTSSAQEAFAGLTITQASPPKVTQRSGMRIAMPPTNGKGSLHDSESEGEEPDEDDPFADTNAIHTPKIERPGMTW